METAFQFEPTPEITELVAEVDEFKGRWKDLKTLSPETLASFRRTATIESVGSSTRIEGARLSNSQVSELLSNLQIDSFRSRDEEEVAGYAEAMNLVFDAWDVMPVTENHIRQLHRVVLQHSTKDDRHRGEYKSLANSVAAFGPSGKQIGIIFETTSPFDTPFEMAKLVGWCAEMEKDGGLHPLLTIGIFAVRFLAIHPFQDGNGRLSRVLTTLMLLRSGYNYVPYSSLESIIEENKGGYYAALRKTQESIREPKVDWAPWLTYFLRCLIRQKNRLAQRVDTEINILSVASALGVSIVHLLAERRAMTVAGLVKATGKNREAP